MEHIEIYTNVNKCLFCNSYDLTDLFEKDYTIPLGCYCVDKESKCEYMPFNILQCNKCRTFQTKYLGNREIIYNYNANSYGVIRSTMNSKFADFITTNNDINSIIEIGGGNGELSDIIIDTKKDIDNFKYTIVDPSYSGKHINKKIINNFYENIDIPLKGNTIVMSHVFEHFYEPLKVMEKFSKNDIKYIYLNFPDLEKCISTNNYHVLNPEHIYYVENDYIKDLFQNYGFIETRRFYHMDHSVFFEFERIHTPTLNNYIYNKKSVITVPIFLKEIINRIDKITEIINNSTIPIYIWPCSMHTVYLYGFGLDTNKLTGVLDNSPHKIGKYLYGTNLLCSSFDEKINSNEKCIIILNGGCYNIEVKNNVNSNITFI